MRVLIYAVRIPVILKYFGQLCFVLGLLTVVPLAVALVCGDYGIGLRYAAVVSFACLTGGLLKRIPASSGIQPNEAMVVTAMIFLFASLVMSFPASATASRYTDAVFETISAVTTTGLSTMGPPESMPASFLFSRVWMQWVGGLGIVVLTLATLIQPGVAAKRMGEMESDGEDLVGGTRAHARSVFTVYLILSAVGIVGLTAMGTGFFEAVLYTLSAVSTGGFASRSDSLSGLEPAGAAYFVIALCLAGGIALIRYAGIRSGGWRRFFRDAQLNAYLMACGVTTVVLTFFLWRASGLAWWRAVEHGVLNALSAQSTAGFSSLAISGVDAGSKLVLILAMFLGGSIGSTAGGIKVIRFLALLRVLHLMIRRTAMPPDAAVSIRIGGQRMTDREIQDSLSLILLYVIIAVLSWLPFVAMGLEPLDSLFDVVSALGTVGLSAGVCQPDLHPLLKTILVADMLLGRLEIIAWLVLLAPRTWIGRRMGGKS